jgi:flagellin
MRINHNIASMTTQNSLFKVNREMSKSIQKLSTGLRINSASDDAAGLGVSENLRTQVKGMGQSLRNTQDAIALLNIADGALNEQADILQRMRELVIQAKNDTYTDTERQYMGQEFGALAHELDRIASTTRYNGMQLFATPETSGNNSGGVYASNSDAAAPETAHKTIMAATLSDSPLGDEDLGSGNHFNMMIGGNYSKSDEDAFTAAGEYYQSSAGNMITIKFGQMDTNALLFPDPTAASPDPSNPMMDFGGIGYFGDFSWHPDPLDPQFDGGDVMIQTSAPGMNGTIQDKLNLILQVIDGDTSATLQSAVMSNRTSPTGLDRVNKMRAYIGAMTNRLESSVNNLMNQITNTQAAESLIRDVDMASETANFTKSQILTQSATAMLSQANSLPQGVLSLLR